jgi:hypothetical protein
MQRINPFPVVDSGAKRLKSKADKPPFMHQFMHPITLPRYTAELIMQRNAKTSAPKGALSTVLLQSIHLQGATTGSAN